jgi:pimeloyl-ACP methyl ester carboxylesterase
VNYEDMIKYNVKDQLCRIDKEVLILAGDSDFVFSVEEQRELNNGIKGSKLVVFKKCGHFPFIEKKKDFYREVKEWLIV